MTSLETAGLILTNQKVVPLGVLLALVTYTLHSVGLVAPSWTSLTETHVITTSYFYGLWAECQLVQETGSIQCESWSTGSLSDTFKASQAMAICAFVTITCAVLCVTMSVLLHWREDTTMLVGFNLFYLTGFLTFLAVILFSQAKTTANSSVAWGCVLTVVGGVFSILIGGYFTFVFFFKRYLKGVEKERRKETIKNLWNMRREQKKTKRLNMIGHGQTCAVMPTDDSFIPKQQDSLNKTQEPKQALTSKHVISDNNDTQPEEVDTNQNAKLPCDLPKPNKIACSKSSNTTPMKSPDLPRKTTGTKKTNNKKEFDKTQNVKISRELPKPNEISKDSVSAKSPNPPKRRPRNKGMESNKRVDKSQSVKISRDLPEPSKVSHDIPKTNTPVKTPNPSRKITGRNAKKARTKEDNEQQNIERVLPLKTEDKLL